MFWEKVSVLNIGRQDFRKRLEGRTILNQLREVLITMFKENRDDRKGGQVNGFEAVNADTKMG